MKRHTNTVTLRCCPPRTLKGEKNSWALLSSKHGWSVFFFLDYQVLHFSVFNSPCCSGSLQEHGMTQIENLKNWGGSTLSLWAKLMEPTTIVINCGVRLETRETEHDGLKFARWKEERWEQGHGLGAHKRSWMRAGITCGENDSEEKLKVEVLFFWFWDESESWLKGGEVGTLFNCKPGDLRSEGRNLLKYRRGKNVLT